MIYLISYEKDGSGRKHKVARAIRNRKELLALRNGARNLQRIEAARRGDASAKRKLVQLAYNLGHAEGRLAGCKSIGSYFFHDVDCYDASQSAATHDLILAKKDEIGLMMLERSVSGGWHLVCQRKLGTTILENQVRVARALQLEMDTSAHDLQRVVYSTSGSEDDLPYLDDAIFDEPLSKEASIEEYLRLKEREARGEEELPEGAKRANKHYRPWEDAPILPLSRGSQRGSDQAPAQPTAFPDHYHGIPFAEILRKYWEVNNNGFEPTEGDRDTLTFQLASDLRHICGRNFHWLDQVIPCYDGFTLEEKRQKIQNALASKYEGMPSRLRVVLEALEKSASVGSVPTASAEQMPQEQPPEMPRKLPKLISLLTSKVPDIYKATVAHAVFPPLATHLCQVRFNYTDNVKHEATLMNCVMAGTGDGKGCIDAPIKHIMADIQRRDTENERREEAWKKDCQKKGANKDKQLRPEGLVIQIIDSDMTKPALVTRMDEAEGHFVYVKLNELDLFEQLKGQNGKQHFQLMCLAFDPEATYGQTRVGTQSVTARPNCRFNWNACTTVLKGRRFFRNVLTDGPVSRINFCTIPKAEIGSEQPVFGDYDAAFDEQLKPYIDNLVSARGLIDCPQAFNLARELQQECADFARLSQSETYWNLSHRACVIAWLKACVLYVANGQQWEESIEDFIRWSLNYDLWCKMAFFGADIERAERGDDSRLGTRGPRNLLELLPDEFTLDDAKRVRQQQNLSNEGHLPMRMIRTWINRKYVIQNTEYSFKKSR